MGYRYNPEIRQRRSIRLRDYDYGSEGAYFVTICTFNRGCLFGDIEDGKMQLNEFGRIVETEWLRTDVIRSNVKLDTFIIMPNHFHGILVISGNCRGVLQYAPTTDRDSFRSPSQTIGAIVRGFKSTVTKQINQIRNVPAFPVWQRNYYEHIIRDENELNRIREYIINNPAGWADDENNPSNIKKEKKGIKKKFF